MKIEQLVLLAPAVLATAQLDAINDGANQAVDGAFGIVGGVATLVTAIGGNAATVISAVGGDAISTVTGMAGDAASKAGEAAAPIASDVGAIVSVLSDKGGNIIGTVCSDAHGGLTTIMSGAGSALASATGDAASGSDKVTATAGAGMTSSASAAFTGKAITAPGEGSSGASSSGSMSIPDGPLITASALPSGDATQTMTTMPDRYTPAAGGYGNMGNASSVSPSGSHSGNGTQSASFNAAPAAATAGPMAIGGLLGAGMLVVGLL